MSEMLWSNHRRGAPVRYVFAGILVLLVSGAVAPGALGGGDNKKRPRQLVRTVVYSYTIRQADTEIGRETVERFDYDDNTVRFEAAVDMKMAHGAEITTRCDLLLEADSHFPLEFQMTRNMRQETVEFEQVTDIEMVSNVAVIRSVLKGVENTTRRIVPAGTAILDMTTAHHYYQPLYWYNREVGGVQNFNVLDPMSKSEYSASIRFQVEEPVVVAGAEVEAARFEYARDKITALIWVDADDRIVKVEQGFMDYELFETTDAAPQDE